MTLLNTGKIVPEGRMIQDFFGHLCNLLREQGAGNIVDRGDVAIAGDIYAKRLLAVLAKVDNGDVAILFYGDGGYEATIDSGSHGEQSSKRCEKVLFIFL